MKKVLILSLLIFGLTNMAVAQRYAYVDTQYILDNILCIHIGIPLWIHNIF